MLSTVLASILAYIETYSAVRMDREQTTLDDDDSAAKYYLAVDGGGSSCTAALISSSGTVSIGEAGPCNV